MNEALAEARHRASSAAAARRCKIYNATQPFTDDEPAMKWDGEWHITIEVFRDLGMAFAAVLVLIYVLMVGWFRSLPHAADRDGRHPLLAGRHPARARR